MTSGSPAGGGMRWGDAPREQSPPSPHGPYPAGPPPGSGWAPPPQGPGPGTPPGYYGPPGPGPTGPAGPPTGWAPPGAGGRPRRPVGRILLLAAAAVLVGVVVVVLLLGFLVGPRFLRYDVLDAGAVQQGVTRVVTDDWRRPVSDVRCPSGQRTRPGVTFSCSATVDGRSQQVPVDVVDEAGTYEVGQPR